MANYQHTRTSSRKCKRSVAAPPCTVRDRSLRGHPVIRIANTLTRVTMHCRRRVSLLKTPLALLSLVPKSTHLPHFVTPHLSSTASAFLMHHRLPPRTRGACPHHQQTFQILHEKVHYHSPRSIRIRRKTTNPTASLTEKIKRHKTTHLNLFILPLRLCCCSLFPLSP